MNAQANSTKMTSQNRRHRRRRLTHTNFHEVASTAGMVFPVETGDSRSARRPRRRRRPAGRACRPLSQLGPVLPCEISAPRHPLIPLLIRPVAPSPQILQLFQNLEPLSEGDLVRNSLFVTGGRPKIRPARTRRQLLIVDPPEDITERFRLEDDVAAIYTATRRGRPAAG